MENPIFKTQKAGSPSDRFLMSWNNGHSMHTGQQVMNLIPLTDSSRHAHCRGSYATYSRGAATSM